MNRNSEEKPLPKTGASSTKTINQTPKTQTPKKFPTPPSRNVHNTKTNSSIDTISTIISVLIVISIGIGLWTYQGPIVNYLESLGLRGEKNKITQDTNSLFVGKEIELDGTISKAKDQHYTHLFVHPTYGTVGIRSTTINLNNYSGNIHIKGQVVDFINNVYVIELSDVSLNNTQPQNTGVYISGLTYLPDAHIIFRDMSTEGIIFSKATDSSNVFTLTNTVTQATMTVRYFPCDESTAHNCKRFSESFNNSVGIDFVDSFGNSFYRLADANTWFVSLDNTIGIYLETTDPSLIPLVIKNMQFITNNRANKKFTSDVIKKICSSSEVQMIEPFAISLISHDAEPAISVSSPKANCLIAINPNESLGGKLISISGGANISPVTGSESTITTTNKEENPTKEVITQNPINSTPLSNLSAGDTPQLPLKPGKELKFSIKSAGYTLVFPSPTISYSSFSVKDKIGGLSCRIASNVIAYTDKDNVDTNPSIIVYGCNKGTPQLASNMLSFEAKDMTFIVQVNDKAWINFANNIKVE